MNKPYIDHIDSTYVLAVLEDLLAIPSPSGFCEEVLLRVEREAAKLGWQTERTPKQACIITIPGQAGTGTLALTAHVDTLGAMVRSIKGSGALRFTPVGGYAMNSIEGEYCTVHTRNGQTYTGTILTTSPSVHVYKNARELKREEENLEIRLDAPASSKDEAAALGIRNGDYISFDPRTRVLENGYIKSRHLDDKAGVACLFGLAELIARTGAKPHKTLKLMITSYEEVGHGAAYMPADVAELIAVDMGAIGDDLACTEQDVSICAKDSSGPYDCAMTTRLIRLAERDKLRFAVDIYPQYGSDASAAMRGGNNLRAALIGPGVHASHSLERTHRDALMNTISLLAAYVLEAEDKPVKEPNA
ncbi:M42 family metallopeptidase [Paenibacillus sp. YN15]|uniref:M42 family metallopeptidase n=1 Tax=Paenibacillus sp. YN15 TaxID=1742774 RepID=UPI000DCC29F5|nr:M42 family metallopeptidase [Paenibacillus sp. YN15]RAV02445.1 aminopeptidase [Paenibacillus sp. YN15]